MKQKLFLYFSILLLLGLKFYFSWTGFLNFEGSFFELSRQISSHFTPLRDALYFKLQSNPIGTSLLISGFQGFIGLFSDTPAVALARWPAIVLMIPCILLVRKVLEIEFLKLSDWQASLLTLIIFLHPSIWTYTGKAFSDSYFIVASFSVFCLYFLYLVKPSKTLFVILNLIILLGLSFKLNMMMVVAVLALDLFFDYFKRPQFFRNILKDERIFFGLSFLLGLLGYFSISRYLDIPFRQNNQGLMQLSVAEMFRNIILYNLHFFIVATPISFLSVWALFQKSSRREFISNLVGSFFLLFIFLVFFNENTLFNTGELNFGSFIDQIFMKFYAYVAPILLFFSLFYFVSILQFGFKLVMKSGAKSWVEKFEFSLILFLIALLFFHSFVKPVQRYLLVFIFFYFLHFVLLYGTQMRSKSSWKFTTLFSVMAAGYFIVSLFLTIQSQVRGDAYLELGRMISESDQYRIDEDKDVMHAHLYGNVAEKYLRASTARKLLCIEHVGYDGKDFSADEVVFKIEKSNFLNKQKFRLFARDCSK